MIEMSRNLAYWIFVLWTKTLNLKIRLTWNRMFNPLRYATMLYAIPMILGLNPQDHEKCDIALMRLPFGTRRHIHDLCVKTFFPTANDEYCEHLFHYYLVSTSEIYSEPSYSKSHTLKAYSLSDLLTFYRELTLTSMYVEEQLMKIPHEFGRAITRKHWHEWEKTQPSFKEMLNHAKAKHPEYPPEFWSPYEQLIKHEKK